MKSLFLYFLFSIIVNKVNSQQCLKNQTFKVKDAKCIVNGQKVLMPFAIDVKSYKDSINLIIYEPGNKIDLMLRITSVDTCNTDIKTGDYKGVFKATITEVDEDQVRNTESRVVLQRKSKIYTLQFILPQLNNSELILTMTEIIKRRKK